MAPATWDKWQLEVDLGQLKAMEGVTHVNSLIGALGDEGLRGESDGRADLREGDGGVLERGKLQGEAWRRAVLQVPGGRDGPQLALQ